MIRLAHAGDAGPVQRIYAPIVADTPISFEEVPPDEEEIGRRIEKLVEGGLPWLVLEDRGTIAGYAYASRHRERAAYRWSVEVSAYVHADFRRQGVAQALYTSLFAVLVLQRYCNAYAGITLPNAASVAFHQTLGFTFVGVYRGIGYKAGAWHDVAWYERALALPLVPPPEPRPLPEVMRDDAWEQALRAGVHGLEA